MKIGFLTFDQYTQHKNSAGTRIRAKQLIKLMPEAEEYVQGKKYDVVVFQKAYWKEGIKNLKCKKILDICDPDYLQNGGHIEMFNNCDLITVPTEPLKNDIQNYTKTRVEIIKDRFDLSELPKPRTHKGRARKAVWFGFSANIEPLEQAILNLRKNKLELIVISDGNYNNSTLKVTNIKWKPKKFYQDIQKADIAVLPTFSYGNWKYKSNNRKILSELLGVPCADTPEELDNLMRGNYRQKQSKKLYQSHKKEYNVKKSVKELKKLIKEI